MLSSLAICVVLSHDAPTTVEKKLLRSRKTLRIWRARIKDRSCWTTLAVEPSSLLKKYCIKPWHFAVSCFKHQLLKIGSSSMEYIKKIQAIPFVVMISLFHRRSPILFSLPISLALVLNRYHNGGWSLYYCTCIDTADDGAWWSCEWRLFFCTFIANCR